MTVSEQMLGLDISNKGVIVKIRPVKYRSG